MPGSVAVKTRRNLIALSLLFSCVGYSLSDVDHAFAQSTISATICASSSTISIATPTPDSVVVNPDIQVSGSVMQANQVEISIDDALDSVIAVAAGQNTFGTAIRISPGTHTIKASVISSCPGIEASASSVVTFTPPPATTGSTGSETTTGVNEEQKGTDGVVIVAPGEELTAPPSSNPGLIQSLFVGPILQVAEWLNIGKIDSQTAETSSMSPLRAASIGIGMWLTTFGAASVVVQAAAASPIGASLVSSISSMSSAASSSPSLPSRMRFFSRASRIIGILLLGGALFL